MADDQALTQQDIQDLQDISSKLPAGHPTQKKIALLINSQKTQFEQERDPANQKGFLQTVKEKAASMIPPDPTGGRSLLDPKAWYNPDEAKFAPSSSPFVHQATRPLPPGVNNPLYRAASIASPLVPGLNPEAMERASDVGDTGALAAETAVPTAMALSPYLTRGAGRAGEAIRPTVAKMAPTIGAGAGYAIGHWPGLVIGREAGLAARKLLTPGAVESNPFPGAALPDTNEFYAHRGAELNAARKLDVAARKQQAAAASSDAARSRTDASGAMNPPLRPLVGTPEEWQTYDAQKAILKPEASDAGLFSAARGAVNKKLNYQQRIERKLQ